jgi:hypothetical protein
VERDDPLLASPFSDADGDGFPILLAYGLGAASGSVPEQLRPGIRPLLVNDSPVTEITYTRKPAADVAVVVETATSPVGPWQVVGDAAIVATTPLPDGVQQVRKQVPQAEALFVRLRAVY